MNSSDTCRTFASLHRVVLAEQERPHFDNSGVQTYRKTCRKLKQLPIRHVCEALVNSKPIEVRNRGLSAYGTLGITNALLVSGQARALNSLQKY